MRLTFNQTYVAYTETDTNIQLYKHNSPVVFYAQLSICYDRFIERHYSILSFQMVYLKLPSSLDIAELNPMLFGFAIDLTTLRQIKIVILSFQDI